MSNLPGIIRAEKNKRIAAVNAEKKRRQLLLSQGRAQKREIE